MGNALTMHCLTRRITAIKRESTPNPEGELERTCVTMLTIETIATIGPDGMLTAMAPPFVPRGVHRVVITVDETMLPEAHAQKLPDLTTFRESLMCPTYTGNAVVEYRQEERS